MSFFSTKHDAAPAARAQMPDGDHASLGAAATGLINRDCEPLWAPAMHGFENQ
jgi:hypothetical protein